MNARQKAKKYKKELNRLRDFLNPGKVVYEDVKPIRCKNATPIRYKK